MIEVWRHHRAIGNIVVALLVGVFLLLLVTSVARTGEVVSAIRSQQQSSVSTLTTTQHAARDAARTARLIESCTTPGRRCYERSQARTADAVNNINRVVILAAACASQRNGQSVAAIQSCVINGLADQKGRR